MSDLLRGLAIGEAICGSGTGHAAPGYQRANASLHAQLDRAEEEINTLMEVRDNWRRYGMRMATHLSATRSVLEDIRSALKQADENNALANRDRINDILLRKIEVLVTYLREPNMDKYDAALDSLRDDLINNLDAEESGIFDLAIARPLDDALAEALMHARDDHLQPKI